MKITQPHHDPLLEQLRLFNEAAEALTRQWSLTEDDGNHPIVMCDKYPFDDSFDDIALNIHEWYEAALKYQPSDCENLLTTLVFPSQSETAPDHAQLPNAALGMPIDKELLIFMVEFCSERLEWFCGRCY